MVIEQKFVLLTARPLFVWSTWQSRSREVSWKLSGQLCDAARCVLDPNGTSEDVAGRRG